MVSYQDYLKIIPRIHKMEKVENLSSIEIARVYKAIEGLHTKMASIDGKLETFIKMEERVETHTQTMLRFGELHDEHIKRIHSLEIWQASHSNDSKEQLQIKDLQSAVSDIESDLSLLANGDLKEQGKKELLREIFKWAAGIAAALIIFSITNPAKAEGNILPQNFPICVGYKKEELYVD